MTIEMKKDKILERIRDLYQEKIEFVTTDKKDEDGSSK